MSFSGIVFGVISKTSIRDIAAEMLALRTGLSPAEARERFCQDSGYQTPKIDTRAAIFQQDSILLVHERSGGWSLPGGWCEYDLSPARNVVKEAREEAGLETRVEKLIAVLMRPQNLDGGYPFAVAKHIFLCSSLSGSFQPNPETTESAYFPLNDLPPLALGKSTPEQIALCFQAAASPSWQTRFE